MISIRDRLQQRSDESPHQAPFLFGFNQKSQNTSKKTKNCSRTSFRRTKKIAKSYMDNAKSMVESSPSYVKVYDKEKPHRLQTMTPIIKNKRSKNYTIMPSVTGAHFDHPIQFISE